MATTHSGIIWSIKDYYRTHGKDPRGFGMWAFRIDTTIHTITGSCGEAKQEALRRARTLKAARVEVLG